MGLLDRFRRPRETAAERADWLRSLTGAVINAHAEHRSTRRSFETAETPAWVDTWSTGQTDLNEELAAHLPTLRARSVGLARNNEWAAGYLKRLETGVLGKTAIPLQAQMKRRDGSPDTAANDALESAFRDFSKRGNFELSGRHSRRDCEALALKSLESFGEILYRIIPGARGGVHPFKVQMLPPQILDVHCNKSHAGNRVRMGVEIDDAGQPLYYWLRAHKIGDDARDGYQIGQHVRVPAAEIRHFFVVEEVGQLRGIPGLSIGARRLHQIADFEDSAAVASRNAAKREGFFKSQEGDLPPGFADQVVSQVLDAARASGKTLSAEEITQITAAASKYSTTLPGQYDTLPLGYDFVKYESDWPNLSAEGFVKGGLRGWSSARGFAYSTIGNDLEAVNFSSGRIGIGNEREQMQTIQARLIDWFDMEIARAWLPYAVVSDARLQPARIDKYLAALHFHPRSWPGIDPLKEEKAAETALSNKTNSRRRIILARGDDPDEVFAEIEAEEARFGSANKTPDLEPDAADETEDESTKPAPRTLRAIPGSRP